MTNEEVTRFAAKGRYEFEKMQRPQSKQHGDDERVDKTSGFEAQPCPGFVCTRHELAQLAMYWYRVGFRSSQSYTISGRRDEKDWREMHYADERIDEIWKHLGEVPTVRIANLVAAEMGWSDPANTNRRRPHWRARLAGWFK